MNREIDSLREYVRLAWIRFNEGYSSYLEVTNAQNLLYTAELDRAAVQRVLFQAYANLYRAMGIGA
jgi:multidrug efflux system outer membrane protein